MEYTPQKAIANINEVLNSTLNYDDTLDYQLTTDDCNWLEISKSALEKQIPKKPKIIKYESKYDTRDYFCPICNKCFIHFVDGEFYAGKKDCWCSECGQKNRLE